MTERPKLHTPESLWPVDADYLDQHEQNVREGVALADKKSLVVVSICRDSMPYLPNTLLLLDCVAQQFKDFHHYVFENDSSDGSAEALDSYASVRPWVTVEHGPPMDGGDDRGAFQGPRTERLAKCRNRCLEFVRERHPESDYVAVLDTDPHFGWSPDGLFSSVAWIERLEAGAMASFSLYMTYKKDGHVNVAHYDAWPARLNWWNDRREQCGYGWFSMLLPPVGSPPFPLNSAFGGLCLYKTKAFLAGGYSGEDCEHVPHHRRMHEAGWKLWLNPGCLYGAYMMPCEEE